MAWLTCATELPYQLDHQPFRSLPVVVSLRGRRVDGVWTRVRVVTWFGKGTHPWGDPRGALASDLRGKCVINALRRTIIIIISQPELLARCSPFQPYSTEFG